MGLFDFFKTKKNKEDLEDKITFRLENPDKSILSKCKVDDYVNLWTKIEVDKINIYSSSSMGGSGLLGTIPNKYYKKTKDHILNQKDYGFSGPSTNNYEAKILEISSSSCTISIIFLSPDRHEKRILSMIDKDKTQIKIDLEKAYRLTKPVKIIFDIKNNIPYDLLKLKLKILEKQYYLENPYDCKIQLVNDKDDVIGDTYSQKDKVFRIVKAYFNNQSLFIDVIEKKEDKIIVLVIPEKKIIFV